MPAIDPAPITLQAGIGQPLDIELEAMPGAGLVWQPPAAPPGCRLDAVDSQPAGAGIGGPTLQRFVLTCDAAGQHQLRFELKRPWEQAVRTVQRVDVTVR